MRGWFIYRGYRRERKNRLLLLAADCVGKPLQTLKETFTGCSTTTFVGRQEVEQNRTELLWTYLGWTYHKRSRIRCSPSFSVTSAGAMAVIANTRRRIASEPNQLGEEEAP